MTFLEFLAELSGKEKKKLEHEAKAGDYLRYGVMNIKDGKVLLGLCKIFKSIYHNPCYIGQKLKHNLKIFK